MKEKKRDEKKASERNVSSEEITSLKVGSFAVAVLILLSAVFVAPLSALPTTTGIPIQGSISVSSSPSGATIHLDGLVGPSVTTPYTFANLLIGTHALVLTLDGYEIWSADVPVLAGETSHVHAILTPIPTTGSISVSSSPSGATIHLDGLVGPSVTTPYTFADLSIGAHTLELALDGYEIWSTTVQVSAGEISPVHAIMALIPTPPPTKGAIFVNSSPSGATIELDTPDGSFDGPSVTTPYNFTEISPGSSTITLALDGYECWSTIVQVSAGETSPVHATLTPHHVTINEIMYNPPGSDRNREWIELFNGGPEGINITSWKFFESSTNAYHEFTRGQGSMVIPSGGYAIVAVDAPTFLNEHPACNCTVIESGFWLSNTGDSITLKDASSAIIDEVSYHNSWGASGNGKTLELNLTGGWEESLVDGGTPPTTTGISILGSISVSSSPSGATIHLDGFVGPSVTTPYTFDNLSIGAHTLELALDGYEIWSADVPVLAGEISHVHAILTPIPTTGSISVSSSPSGATIHLDGLVGPSVTTPYTFADLSIGAHTLELALDGYEIWSADVPVLAGEISHVDAIMALIPPPPPTKGAIFVNSSPSGATIELDTPDGSFDGPSVTTPYNFTEISPGSSTITLALDGYESWSTIVQVSAGETSPVHATLTPYHVTINEIMYNPPGSDRNREWIELFNGGPEGINITSWKFFESSTNAYHEFTRGKGSMVIPSGGYAIVAVDAATFLNEHPACNCTVIESGFWLSNTGDSITLKDASSVIVDEVSYHNSWGASGNGKTLELNLTGGWEESLVDGGTPCNPNSVTI